MKVINSVKTVSFLQKYNACFIIVIDLLVFFLFCCVETYKNFLSALDNLLLKCLEQLKCYSFQTVGNLVLLVEN